LEPLSDVRDVSRLAYGFVASKALFAALNLDLFSRLEETRTLEDLARETGMASSGNRKTTFAKLAREQKLRERRLEKQAKKDARKRASEDQPTQVRDTPAAEQR
jgi:hypothetical protein